MKKYLTLLLFLSVAIHSYYVGMIDAKHVNPLVIQENETISSSAPGDIHPVDGDLKQKGTNIVYGLVITLMLIINFSFHRFIRFIKRITVLCPVFFQSNYVIKSSMKLI